MVGSTLGQDRAATPDVDDRVPRETLAVRYPSLTSEQSETIRTLLQRFKSDPRGPYLRIRWFCNDGRIVPPTSRACAEHGGGHQRAELTVEASRLADLGFHVGTILMSLSYDEFLDAEHGHYRLRELLVEDYVRQLDDGWVLRRARFYRGASQSEDEERQGRNFLETLLVTREWRARHPLLATQLALTVPHGQAGVPGRRIRSLAGRIAELDPAFQDVRIKIHSRPGPDDLDRVAAYRDRQLASAPRPLREAVDELHRLLGAVYTGSAFRQRLEALAVPLRWTTLGPRVTRLATELETADARRRVKLLAGATRDARRLLGADDLGRPGDEGGVALAVLDFINYATALLNTEANVWVRQQLPGPERSARVGPDGAGPPTRAALVDFLLDLVDATYGSGLLAESEYEALRGTPPGEPATDVPAGAYHDRIQQLGRALDWAAATARQTVGMALEQYEAVEPVAARIPDEIVRSSPLLPYAAVIDVLTRDAAAALGFRHSVFGVTLHSRIAALNPGVAVGRLSIIERPGEVRDLDPEGIYLLPETPASLGRVAGILTLEEGSRLSHVQLLARSFGLPNAVVDAALLPRLREHDGERVFYAVSPQGAVVLKRAEAMTDQDRVILGRRAALGQDRLSLDGSKLALEVTRVLRLEEVDLADSGRLVGPKAANLGRLRRLFPDRVAPGLVVPFGVFRQHIDRDLRNSGQTLYEDLLAIHAKFEEPTADGRDRAAIDRWLAGQLDQVREAITGMDLLPEFERDLRAALRREFGADGAAGVFVRSDTNVEDLPNFTGAGLNLTVMNQVGVDQILDAIKRVWASAFSARAYAWRQRALATPEHVYPAVILLQSVPVEVSGVLATIDLTTGGIGAWTVALAEGIGGVVAGEPAETMLVPVTPGPPVLLSSARSIWRDVLRMDATGGVVRVPVRGDPVLLTLARLSELRAVTQEILDRYPPVRAEDGRPVPWDVEFGFVAGGLKLFQIRPLVNHPLTNGAGVLAALDPMAAERGMARVALDEPPTLQGRVRP